MSHLTYELHFRDGRPPHEVKYAMEREVSVLFTSTMDQNKLFLRAQATIVGATYDLLLRFEAAQVEWNHYSLRVDVSWVEQATSYADYYRKTSSSWFALWTCNLKATDPQAENDDFSERYFQLCDDLFNTEKQLDSISAIQHAIVTSLQQGASFRTSHKEGGTHIYWKGDRFVQCDFGENPDERHFTDESEFLKMLRQLCHWEVNRNFGKETLSEMDAWKLILRRMNAAVIDSDSNIRVRVHPI